MTVGVQPAIADAALLGALAALASEPVPVLLAQAGWPRRSPRRGLAAWIALGTLGWLATAATLLALGTAERGGHLVANLWVCGLDLAAGRNPLGVTGWICTGAGLALLAWQTAFLAVGLLARARRRRAHRAVVDLVGTHDAALGAVVLDDPRPLAYHLPGLGDHRLVLTRGTLGITEEEELRAVMAHERAHLSGRHDLLIQWFLAWRRCYPGVLGPGIGLRMVTMLTEMVADDAAVRSVGPATTLAAIHRMGCGSAGRTLHEPWSPDHITLQRARRLMAAASR